MGVLLLTDNGKVASFPKVGAWGSGSRRLYSRRFKAGRLKSRRSGQGCLLGCSVEEITGKISKNTYQLRFLSSLLRFWKLGDGRSGG